MKLLIEDAEYDITSAIDNSALGDLIKLKVQTTGLLGDDSQGVTVPWARAKFNQGMAAMTAAPTLVAGEEALQADSEFLLAVASIIWLAKRKAGEQFTFDQALALEFDDFRIVFEEADFVTVAADPKDRSSEEGESTEPLPTPTTSTT